MSWKKNVCSYLLWLIYTMAVILGGLGCLSVLSAHLGFPEKYCYWIAGGCLLEAGLAVFGIHSLIAQKGAKRWKLFSFADKNPEVTEGILFVVLLAAGILLRVGGLQNAADIAAGLSEGNLYFEASKVTEGYRTPQVVHAATYLYLELLHVIFLLFGNKIMAAVCLQAILQCLAGVILYVAVRKLSGWVPALVMFGFVMLSPYMRGEMTELSPQFLFLTYYAVVLTGIANTLKRTRGNVFVHLFIGLLIGIGCYFDLSGITLLLFAAGVFTVVRSKPAGKWNKRGFIFLWNVLGAAAGWGGMLLLDAVASKKTFSGVLLAWSRLYQVHGFSLTMEALPVWEKDISVLVGNLILFFLLTLGIFSFWCRKGQERQGIWIFSSVSLLLLQCLGMMTPYLSGNLLLYCFLTVLAGVGLKEIFAVNGRHRKAEKADRAEEEFLEKELEIEDLAQGTEMQPTPEEQLTSEEPAEKVRLLENPLPMPKKHEARVMNYRITNVNSNDFDLEIAEDDDYDIK